MVNELSEVPLAEDCIVPCEENEMVPGFVNGLRWSKYCLGRAGDEEEILHIVEELGGFLRRDAKLLLESLDKCIVAVCHDIARCNDCAGVYELPLSFVKVLFWSQNKDISCFCASIYSISVYNYVVNR